MLSPDSNSEMTEASIVHPQESGVAGDLAAARLATTTAVRGLSPRFIINASTDDVYPVIDQAGATNQ